MIGAHSQSGDPRRTRSLQTAAESTATRGASDEARVGAFSTRSGRTRSALGAAVCGDGSGPRAGCGGAGDGVTTGGAVTAVLLAESVEGESGSLRSRHAIDSTTTAAAARIAMTAIRRIPARGCDAGEDVRGASTGDSGTGGAGCAAGSAAPFAAGGRQMGTWRTLQNSTRFLRLVATNGCRGGSDATAIACARR